MASVEAISVLAVIEAQDKASGILSGIFSTLERVGESFKAAGTAAEEAGVLQSRGLLEGATATERLAFADEQLTRAQEEAFVSTQALRDSQENLLVTLELAGNDAQLVAAAQRELREAQLTSSIASGQLKDAQLAQAAASKEVTTASAASKNAVEAGQKAMIGIGAATLAASGYSVKLAADFQQQTQTFVAGAGVQQTEIDGVRQNILQLAQDTGTSTKDLNDAFFQVKSRMDKVSDAEVVMKDAAELAKVHMADLKTVSIALASSMNAYAQTGLTAEQASNILGVAVEKGGMSFQDLANSLSTVLPKAQEAGVSFAQVTAAVATMTGSGQSAQQATQDLAHTIGKLQSPTHEMINTWNQLGLTQKQVSDALHGPGGLEAAMNLIANTAKSKLGPNGEVVIKTLKESKDAANSLTQALDAMDPAAKKLGESLVKGSISSKEYTKAAKDLNEAQSVQALQFKSLYDKANGFNDAIKSGKPGFSDFSALLKSSYGDATSMQTALLLGGQAADKWAKITKEAGDAAGDTSGKIRGWDALQGTLNQKMAQAKEALSVAAITLGTALLPAVTRVVQAITPWIEKIGQVMAHHQNLTKILVAFGLALGTVVVALKSFQLILSLLEPLMLVFNAILAANPIALVAVAVAGLVAGLVLLYNHSEAARNVMNQMGEYLKTGLKAAIEVAHAAIDGLKDVIKGMFDWIDEHKQTFIDAWDAMVKEAKKAAEWFDNNVIKWIKGLISEFETWWQNHAEQLEAVWNFLWTIIKTNALVTFDLIKGSLQTFFGFWDLIWDGIKDTAILVWDAIKNVITLAIHLIENIIAVVLDLITGHWGQAWQDLKKLAWDALSDLWNFISGLGKDAWHLLEDAGKNIIKGLINGIKSMASSVKNTVSDIVGGIRNLLPFSPAKEGPLSGNGGLDYAGKTMGKMLSDGLRYNIPMVKSAAGAMAGAASINAMAELGLGQGNAAFNAFGSSAMAGTMASGMGLGVGPMLGGGAPGEIHIHLDQGSLQGTVITDSRAMDDFTQRLGYHIASKVLPQAGVRIRG